MRRSLGRALQPGTAQRGPGPPQRTRPPRKHNRKHAELLFNRDLQLDSASSTAFMTLNTFEHGYHLRTFFKHGFHLIKEKQMKNIVIDVRSNGGGDASLPTLLTRYLIDKKFKLADSLYCIRISSRFDHYIGQDPIYSLLTWFVSRKGKDGYYHFGHFERHYFAPFGDNHFDGHIYIL